MKVRPITVVLLALSLLVVALPAAVSAGGFTTVTTFNPAAGELPEGLAMDRQGNLYVGFAPTAAIVKLAPSGAVSSYAQLPSPQATAGFLVGLAFDSQGEVLYAALSSFDPATHGIWRVRQGGTVVERFAALDPQSLPNGFAFRGDTVYVSDSFGGQVWAIDPQGSARVWKADPLLQGDPTVNALGLSIGANGIAFRGSSLYVANNDRGLIVRIPVNSDGSAGAVEVVADDPELLRGADGIAFDDAGRLYVAANGHDRLVVVAPEPGGAVTVLEEGAPLDFPASLVVRDGELFVTNFALLRAQSLLPGAPSPSVLKRALPAVVGSQQPFPQAPAVQVPAKS